LKRLWALSLPALAASMIWALSFVFMKWAVAELATPGVVVLRFGVASLASCLLLPAARRAPGRICPWHWVLVLAVVSISIPHLFYTQGLRLTSALHGGWIMGWQPALTALVAVPLLRERLTRWGLVGIGIGALGMTLVISEGGRAGFEFSPTSVLGDLLVLIAVLLWAVQGALGRKYAGRCSPLPLTLYTTLVGWVLLLPWGGVPEIIHAFGRLSLRFWISIVYLGVLASLAAYWLWYRALETWEAGVVAAYLYLEPPVTSVAAALVLHEKVSMFVLFGGALILAGLLVVQYSAALRVAERARL